MSLGAGFDRGCQIMALRRETCYEAAMRLSQALIPTLKEAPREASIPSHIFLLRAGYIRMVGAGLYQLLPLAMRSLHKITHVVRREMDRVGAQEILMPALLPKDFFAESGRWDTFGEALLRLKDRKGSDYYLGPTHEEVITDLARRELRSYKQLPLCLYQVQMKYRDEPRPRGGLLRTREFLMKDAYSFDLSEEAATEHYMRMRAAYQCIFSALDLRYCIVGADAGAMGGSRSAEFQIVAQHGEDRIVSCTHCEYADNLEVAGQGADSAPCPRCGAEVQSFRGIEGGHIFILGTHYSQAMGARVVDEAGVSKPVVMGCYGIGISRLLAAAAEQHHDDQGLCWPLSLAPYAVTVCALGKEAAVREKAQELYDALQAAGVEVLFDDRDERPGVKLKDADLIGIPLRLAVGARSLQNNAVEWKWRHDAQVHQVPLQDCVMKVKEVVHG